MLHGDHGAGPTERRADALIEGNLLVGGPVSFDLLVPGEILQHLGTRCSRIAGGEQHPGFPGTASNGFIAG
jgi:hypothetical protein